MASIPIPLVMKMTRGEIGVKIVDDAMVLMVHPNSIGESELRFDIWRISMHGFEFMLDTRDEVMHVLGIKSDDASLSVAQACGALNLPVTARHLLLEYEGTYISYKLAGDILKKDVESTEFEVVDGCFALVVVGNNEMFAGFDKEMTVDNHYLLRNSAAVSDGITVRQLLSLMRGKPCAKHYGYILVAKFG